MVWWAWLLIVLGAYTCCAIVIGSIIAAEHIRDNREEVAKGKKDNDLLSDEQGGQVFLGGLFWPIFLPFIIGGYITSYLVAEKPPETVKCILCGTKSPPEAMYCNHCGNQMKGVLSITPL